jgi:hypothetical protein
MEHVFWRRNPNPHPMRQAPRSARTFLKRTLKDIDRQRFYVRIKHHKGISRCNDSAHSITVYLSVALICHEFD